MSIRNLTIGVLSLLMVGCVVPSATTYYHPSAQGGNILTNKCSQTASIIELSSLPLVARVVEGHNKALYVIINLPTIRPENVSWKTFNFTSSEFEVYFPESGQKFKKTPSYLYRNDKSTTMTEPYSSSFSQSWSYTVEIKIEGKIPEQFQVTLPPLIIDGVEQKIPPINFKRKVWMGIAPFNC
ncbi:hypothetical protein QCB45_01950 [Thiomicrorhabdus sp. ZW0627]|uniref:hypothetical protein n=1 Tax=Thiomicrorhabdus sp. ZW0627 TaxID=3039774 RepID=UPI0024370FB2|nr:hypothetical protein [Thiomicrorhabdus sp. ZW0627]MDG6773077.1 hypothetical protein [Thiomicrorhabdus sp. ZW0627]